MAYDRSQGNPLSKYRSADFDLAKMSTKPVKVNVVTCQDNRLVMDVLDEEFRIEVTGFDENRDIYVKARTREIDE